MKRLLWIIPLVIAVLVSAAILYIKLALPNVGPSPDIKVELTPDRIARGEYLANNLMACVDCHSQRDFTRFAGPITGAHFAGGGPEFTVENGAPGNFYATNLTPFHLQDWTDGDIYRAITAGVSKDGRALFPAMPSHLYGQASEEDIFAVIAYLRTLPSVENNVLAPEPAFPFSIIMNTIPKKQDPGKMPNPENKVEYGKYVITLAACIDCHTPMEKGQYLMDEAYSGNREFILPTGIVRSSNITPDKSTGIGNWTEDFFVQRFKMYADSAYTAPLVNDGFNSVMPWGVYSKMNEEDLKAIFAYLQSIPAIQKQVVKYSPANK